MDFSVIDWLPIDAIQATLSAPFGEVWVALGFLALAASVYASGIPGTLLPMSFTSGAVLGGGLGALAVATGAMIGSMLLFAMMARTSEATIRKRYADKLSRLDGLATTKGLAPLIALRLAGLPHLLVTALCALAGVDSRRYAVATAVGVLPAIALSSLAGASLW